MYQYDREYKAARAVYTWLEFVGWATIVLGGTLVLSGFATGGILGMMYGQRDLPFGLRLLAALPGVGTGIAGLFTVAYVQTSRSHIDVAEMSREMLDIARKGVVTPMQNASSVRQQIPSAKSSDDAGSIPNEPMVGETVVFRGFSIHRNEKEFLVAGFEFQTFALALVHIHTVTE